MKAREWMTAQPACCTPDDSLQHAAREMQGQDCGCIPIIEDQHDHRLVGLVTDRNIACRGVAAGMNPDTPLSQVTSPAPKSCDLDDDVETVERIMAEEQVRRVPVVDSRNRAHLGTRPVVGHRVQHQLRAVRHAAHQLDLAAVVPSERDRPEVNRAPVDDPDLGTVGPHYNGARRHHQGRIPAERYRSDRL